MVSTTTNCPCGGAEAPESRQTYHALAAQHLQAAQRGLPYDIDVEFMLALLSRRRGEWDTHTKLLETMLRRHPDNLAVLGELGFSYVLTREHERADQLLDRYLEIAPGSLGPRVIKTYNHLASGTSLSGLGGFLQQADTH